MIDSTDTRSLGTLTAVGTAPAVRGTQGTASFQATVTGSAPLSAVVVIEASNDGAGWVELGTITLNDAAPSDGFAIDAPWLLVRARVTALGAGDVVAVTMGG